MIYDFEIHSISQTAFPESQRMSQSPFDIEGVWRGHYHYRRIFGISLMPSVPCYAVFKRDDGVLSGQIYEPNTFVRRATDHLEADILNLELGNGLIRFRKKYNGTGGVSHGIDYRGEVSNDGRRIHGTWSIGWLSSGTFELEKEDPEKSATLR